MVSKVISVWLFVLLVAVSNGAEEPKRDKRTVDVFLRGAADLFGYDVVRRITSPSLRQTAPRPTFFPPPVAPQLPSGTYSRVILALGQQQQQQQQQLQRQLQQDFQVTNPFQPGQLAQQQQAFSLEDLRQPHQRTTILNIPQNGALTASAESINLPTGTNILPVLHVPAPVAQVPLLSAIQAQPVIPVAPFAFQSAALTAQMQPFAAPQQAAPAPAPPTAAAQQNAAPQNAPGQNIAQFGGIPLRLVAFAPGQNMDAQNAPQNAAQQQSAQQTAPQQPQQQQNGSQMPTSAAPATPASGTNAQQAQPQPPNSGVNIVLDQGPTRWNLIGLSPPRPESVRRSLNLNLNWNRNVEPASAAQFQLVPVPLEATQTTAQAGQQAQAQQQQLPTSMPTIENFDITTAAPTTNSAFNRYYNVPDNFQARTAAQTQNDNNVQFRESIRQFWQTSPWSGVSENPRRANLQEEVRPRFEEYNLETNAEELNAPETEQIVQEEQNEVVAPSEENNREELNDGNEVRSRTFRLNSNQFDEESRESSDAPKFRRKNKIRRIRKVKKSVDNSDESKSKIHQVYKREKKSLSDEEQANGDVKNYYKKFTSPKSD